ncbi:MAG: DUF885 domain-containing protein [Proteobacteria bacterium]|nr:DUF885 domain-containing protein [Pseudomonadota bacterium]
MKKLFKWLGTGLLAVFVLLSVFALHTAYFRPVSLGLFYNKVFMEFVFRNPELLSSMGLLESVGLHYKNDQLTDISPQAESEDAALVRKDLKDLLTYDSSGLQGEDKLSYEVLEFFLKDMVDGETYRYHQYPVNQLYGVQNELPLFMATQHQITSLREAEDYIARLNNFEWKFSGLVESLRLRETKGIIPQKFVVKKVLKEMQGFIGKPAEDNILYTAFVEKVDKLDDLATDVRESLRLRAATAIQRSVYPAYQQLIHYFRSLKPKATTNNGVWALPDGAGFYAYMVRHHTTTTMTPAQIHKLGRAEVTRIEAEMDLILCAHELCEGDIGERMQVLGKDPRYLHQAGETTNAQVLQDYQDIIDEITRHLPDWFGTLPKASVIVKRTPEFKQETAPIGGYYPPPLDGSRPGIFFANLRDLSAIPKWSMRTLAYHEAIPGHHMQIAMAHELEDLPMFRSFLGFTAFQEGWALYTEQLAWEMGLLEDPLDNLGRLQMEMFRAVRLVVDTGIHSKRWSRERAIRFMSDKTGLPKNDVIAEIERYFVQPGQALAYKVGMLKILELRQRAQDELGDKFDIRSFHDAVLTHGQLPLILLEQEINQYIDNNKGLH